MNETECTDAGYISAGNAEYLQEVFSCGVTWDMEIKHSEDIKKANKEYHAIFNATYGRVNLMGHRLCSPDDEEQRKFTEFLFKFGSDTFRRVAQFPNRESYHTGRRG